MFKSSCAACRSCFARSAILVIGLVGGQIWQRQPAGAATTRLLAVVARAWDWRLQWQTMTREAAITVATPYLRTAPFGGETKQ